ncbi:MAG: tricarboxylate transporter [candidate division NC10 bacterium RIFCSPLOWO2_02_FULL_66_22]|nr:MAG: tricarboxylate transporter [candidate division NC10 bacterium RIFCSPLOWO2_02_FULL_66_22]
MQGFGDLLYGFNIALSPYNLFIAAFGVLLGVIIGVIPGLGGTSGVAILLPLTFTMPTTSAIVFLSSIYWGALYGGAITSILFNIPGEPWSVALLFDGYPMAREGKAGQALALAFIPGFFAALVSIVLFTFFAPLLAGLALKFGPAETFAVLTLAFSTFTGLGGGSPAKTIASACVGFLLASVGLDIVTGRPRLTFGSITILSGFSFITASIGLFGIGEILLAAEETLEFKGIQGKIGVKDMWVTTKTMMRNPGTFITGTILGFWIGVMPGTGATPASFMSYGIAKQYSKHPEKFGTGAPQGIIASQTAAQAAGIGALLPLVTLGIPGSPTAAVILGGLYIWGLQPGPTLFIEQRDFVWGLIASMYIGNVMGVLFCLAMVPVFTAILKTPYAILTPLIILLSSIGAYAVNNTTFDVWLLLMYGVIGYVFKKLKYPLAPLVVALVLGDMTEEALRQSLILSGGSLAIFFTRPIAAGFMILTIFLFLLPAIRPLAQRVGRTFRAEEAEKAGEG